MSRRSIKQDDEKSDINISPMIDMVFILLIFFIVTTVFVEEQGIEADRPQPGQQSQDDKQEPIKLHIASNGQLYCNGSKIGFASIRSKVAELLRKDIVPVIIEVEQDVPAGKMVTVIDEARLGGADKVLVSPAQRKN